MYVLWGSKMVIKLTEWRGHDAPHREMATVLILLAHRQPDRPSHSRIKQQRTKAAAAHSMQGVTLRSITHRSHTVADLKHILRIRAAAPVSPLQLPMQTKLLSRLQSASQPGEAAPRAAKREPRLQPRVV